MARKGGLGKGLESLMGEANAEVSAIAPTTSVSLTEVKPNKDQPRKNFDEEALEELADSIKQNGVIQPIVVRRKGSTYEIVAGERRYQAAKRAKLKEVPVVIRDVSDEEMFKIALIENLQRSDLNPIEEARGYQKLIKQEKLTQEELGKVLSKSRSAIANTLRLLDLPKEVQEYMTDGSLSAGHARAILAVPDTEDRVRLAEKVIKDHLTVRQTENIAPLYSGRNTERARREPTPQTFKRAARQLRLLLDTNVKVKKIRNKNKIEIEFESDEDLARLVNLLSKASLESDANEED